MAKVALATTDSNIAPEIRDFFESVEKMGLEWFMNQLRALAHHPRLTLAIHGLMQAYYAESVVKRKYLGLAILMVSRLNQGNYCVIHHARPCWPTKFARRNCEP